MGESRVGRIGGELQRAPKRFDRFRQLLQVELRNSQRIAARSPVGIYFYRLGQSLVRRFKLLKLHILDAQSLQSEEVSGEELDGLFQRIYSLGGLLTIFELFYRLLVCLARIFRGLLSEGCAGIGWDGIPLGLISGLKNNV